MITKMFIFLACTAVFLVQSRLVSLEDLQACFEKNELSQEMNLWNVSDEKAKGVVDCVLGENQAVFVGNGRYFLNELMQALQYATNEYNEYSHNPKDEVRPGIPARSADVKLPKPKNCSIYDYYILSNPIQNTSELIEPGSYEACFGRSNITLDMDLAKVTSKQAEEAILCIYEKNENKLTSREVLLFDRLIPILRKIGYEVKINTSGNNVSIIKEKAEPEASSVRRARSPPRRIVRS